MRTVSAVLISLGLIHRECLSELPVLSGSNEGDVLISLRGLHALDNSPLVLHPLAPPQAYPQVYA